MKAEAGGKLRPGEVRKLQTMAATTASKANHPRPTTQEGTAEDGRACRSCRACRACRRCRCRRCACLEVKRLDMAADLPANGLRAALPAARFDARTTTRPELGPLPCHGALRDDIATLPAE